MCMSVRLDILERNEELGEGPCPPLPATHRTSRNGTSDLSPRSSEGEDASGGEHGSAAEGREG